MSCNIAGRTIAALLLSLACRPMSGQAGPDQPPIRIWGHGALGHDYIESLVIQWETGFRKTHPEIQFDNELHGTASAIGSLYTGTGDIAIMGREIWPVEVEAFEDVHEVVRGFVFQSHPPGKGAVKVHVGVDEPGHDEPAICVDESRAGIAALQVTRDANRGDHAILDGDAAPLNQRLALVARDQPPVAHQQG